MLENTEGSVKNGQSIDIGNIVYTRRINVREYRRGSQKWTIQRHRQHSVHKTQDADKQNQSTR